MQEKKYFNRSASDGDRVMPYIKGLKRCLPKPTACIAIDEEATFRETFPDDAHAITEAIRSGMEKNGDANEALVHVVRGHEAVDGKYVTVDCHLDEDAVSRVLRRLCERNIKRPFERRSLVHTYHLDSMSYAVEHRQNTGEVKIRCWDQRCCEMDVRPDLGSAVCFQRRENARPHAFSCRADVHHKEKTERLTVDMSGNTSLQIDMLEEGGGRACLVHRRCDHRFPYAAVCRAVTCLLAARPEAEAKPHRDMPPGNACHF
jgi:hypothetical protein